MKIEPASISPTSYSEDEVLDEAKRLADLLYTIWKAVETENLDKKFWGRVPRVAHWAWETEPKLKRWIKVREARTGGGWRSGGWDRTSSRNTSRDYDGDGDGGGEVSITEEHFEDSGFADGENDEKRVDGEEEEVIVYKGRGTGNVADWRK